ncbi:hypothetical protein Ahy_A07g032807 [Arachis hypogaea]|uniref:Uncharacterized protein n=1 Tax=Arachis hypogaea TaxID=3818 RepID=A0A445C7J7_ARAHY|nr:hypothetical protein Ahy_A07g032807 [Arachis hypogaea]
MKNHDNGVIFECENSLLLRTQRESSLSELKNLILSNLGGLGRKEFGRMGYRLLASLGNGVFRFRLFRLQGDEHVRLMLDTHGRIMAEQVIKLSAEVGDVGGGGSVHSTFMQDDPLLALPPIHVASPMGNIDVGDKDSDEEYIADSNDSDSSYYDDDEEFVPETPAETTTHYVLPPPPPPDYCAIRLMHGVKNYSIRRSAEYQMVRSDRLKYHVQCRQATTGCPWSFRVVLQQNLGYLEVWKVGGAHMCLAPTMSQDQ